MSGGKAIVLSYEEAAKLVAACDTVADTVKLALADLECGRTNLAAARLRSLSTLNPTGGITNAAQKDRPKVASLQERRSQIALAEIKGYLDDLHQDPA